MALVAVHPNHTPHPRYERSAFRFGVCAHRHSLLAHSAWLEDGLLFREANCRSVIPGVLIHGRLDLGGPLVTPWRLAQHWPGSEFVIVSEAGHDARDPGMNDAVVAATDRFSGGQCSY